MYISFSTELTGPVQVFFFRIFFLWPNRSSSCRMRARTFRCIMWLVLLVWTSVDSADYDPAARLNEMLKNETSLQFYAHCFLDEGPCSGDARAMKRMLPDFVATSCGKCSARQKNLACKVFFALQQEKYADIWSQFLLKYDPDEQYRSNLAEFTEHCTDQSKSEAS